MKYYFKAFKNYTNSDGRATRKEFWWFILFHYLFMFIFSLIDALFGLYPTIVTDYYIHSFDYGYFTIAYLLISIAPFICLQVRRLHDIGKSGYWYFIGGIPIIGLYLLYLNLKPSDACANYYGYPSNYKPTAIYDEDEQAENPNQVRFCRKCGYELVDGSDFCSQCGTKIIASVEMNQNDVL